MRIGVGLPNSVPGTDAPTLLEWSRRAEDGPFSSVAVVDRLVWDCYEPMAALAAAARLTRRVRLATTVVIAPLRRPALLIHQVEALQDLSGGRLTLGVAIGARRDDYAAAGVPHTGRGARLDDMLDELRDRMGTGVEILVGGGGERAFARAARIGDGYVHGGGPPRAFARAASGALAAWRDAERAGSPALWGQGYFALGDAADAGRAYMRSYYAFTGPFAERIAEGLLTTPQAVAQFLRGYAEAGCDEVALMPAVADPDQAGLLQDVLERTGWA